MSYFCCTLLGEPARRHIFMANDVAIYNVGPSAIIDMDGMTTVELFKNHARVMKTLTTKKQIIWKCTGKLCKLCNIANDNT